MEKSRHHDSHSRASAISDTRALRRRLVEVDERLRATYEVDGYLSEETLLDPLSDLVHALLGHRTRYEDNDRAYGQLRARFGDDRNTWYRVRDAEPSEVITAIHGVTWPEKKGPAVQRVLHEISERRNGHLSLDFLGKMPTRQARAWLEELPGVGPKTSAIVVMYSTLKMPALVLDTHHHRVAARLGLCDAKAPLPVAEAQLERLIPPSWQAEDYANHHLAMFHHGQSCCYALAPACVRCPISNECPTGRARLSESAGRDR